MSGKLFAVSSVSSVLCLATTSAWAQGQGTIITMDDVKAAVARANAQTVQSLLKQGYTIAGIIPSSAGPGIFLVRHSDLILCFVSETPNSTAVATQYCKPVW